MTNASDTHTAISIVIPTFDRPELLQRAVRSALAAIPKNGEIVVADDNSSLSAQDCLQSLGSCSLRVVKNKSARGAAANRNSGVAVAKGEIILFLDDDDLIRPGYPDAVLKVASETNHVWGYSRTYRHGDLQHAPKPFEAEIDCPDFESLPARKRLAGLGCGFWIRREKYIEIGGLDESYPVNEDTEFCIRLLASGSLPAISTEPGVSLLDHDGHHISDGVTSEQRASIFREIVSRHAAFLKDQPLLRQHLERRYLKMLAKCRTRISDVEVLGDPPSLSKRVTDLGYFTACAFSERIRRRSA